MPFAGRGGCPELVPLVPGGPGGHTPSPPKRALYPVRTRYNDAGTIARAGGSGRTGGNARLIARSHRRRRRAAPRLALGGGPATRRGAQPASDPASRAGSAPSAVKKGAPFLRRRLRRLAHTGPSRRRRDVRLPAHRGPPPVQRRPLHPAGPSYRLGRRTSLGRIDRRAIAAKASGRHPLRRIACLWAGREQQ